MAQALAPTSLMSMGAPPDHSTPQQNAKNRNRALRGSMQRYYFRIFLTLVFIRRGALFTTVVLLPSGWSVIYIWIAGAFQ